MKAVKGVKVESSEAKGWEYAMYQRGTMNLPFRVGWRTCGYMETWEGTADSTGKQHPDSSTGCSKFKNPASATGARKRQAKIRFGQRHRLQFGDRLKC